MPSDAVPVTTDENAKSLIECDWRELIPGLSRKVLSCRLIRS